MRHAVQCARTLFFQHPYGETGSRIYSASEWNIPGGLCSIEILSTGNYSKVVPVSRIGDRSLPFGHLYAKARELYWAFCASITGGCVLGFGPPGVM